MPTRLMMSLSAGAMGLAGLAGTFMAAELVAWTGATPTPPLVLVVQVAGALYLAGAMTNWMARGALLGGIYGRPIAMGNFLHFAIVALALAKALWAGGLQGPVWGAAAVYWLFAAWFGVTLLTSGVGVSSDPTPTPRSTMPR